jgi:two-component system C4-dicarboxylate transport sensor histidine kinase DctB
MSDEKKALLRTSRLSELGLVTATLTHELRQPLFAIRSLAQLALASDAEAQAGHLQSLLKQTESLERVVEAVGAYAREDTGILGPIDPGGPPQACVNLISHRAKERGVKLVLELDRTAPLAAGEPTALLQILVNLAQNAIDASARGQHVWIRTGQIDGSVLMEVQDEGPGISPESVEQIFEAFFTTKGPEQGTGLGLFLVKEMAGRCQADLQLLPSTKGAHFRLLLRPWG